MVVMVPSKSGGQYETKNNLSLKPWKEVRPKEKIINCPTNDPIIKLLGAILRSGFEEEGADYFSGVCKTCSEVYNKKYCGSYWTDIAGVDYSYIKKKATDGGINEKQSRNNPV